MISFRGEADILSIFTLTFWYNIQINPTAGDFLRCGITLERRQKTNGDYSCLLNIGTFASGFINRVV
jgi:hypothetical protein